MLIYDNLECFSETMPDKVCVIHGATAMTYKELEGKAHSIAAGLSEKINKGDRVLVRVRNPVLQLCCIFGTALAGGVCILADFSAPEAFCAGLIQVHGIALTIGEDFVFDDTNRCVLPAVEDSDLFLGALSSGSTGTPKIIWRDHRSWVSAFEAQSRVFDLSGADRLFLAGSLAYTANLNAALHLIYEGGTVIFTEGLLPKTWIQEIITHRATAVYMVPANYRILLKALKEPLRSLKSVVTAGAKIDQDAVKGLVRFFPAARLIEYYGASELGHVSYSTADDLLKHPDSVGKAFPGVRFWTEEDVIWVESPYLAPDYRPRATVRDIGRIDAEGYLYLYGRADSVINSGGVKVIPEQVENVLKRCPGIADAAVVGIEDAHRGQKVGAWIVKAEPGISKADVLKYCHAVLPRNSCPQSIFFIDEIPKNSNGKTDRKKL